MASLNDDQVLLSESFTPGINDVILGRGRKCYSHPGNKKLADMVKLMLAPYSIADTKKAKSEIIFNIVIQVREQSKEGGGFVKLDESTGRYYEVGNHLAREKVSQTFRDALSVKYKSSTSAKSYRRKQERLCKRIHSSTSTAFVNAGWPTPQSLPFVTESTTLDLTNLANFGSLDPLVGQVPYLYHNFPFPFSLNNPNMLFSTHNEWMNLGFTSNHGNEGPFYQAFRYY